MKKKLVVLGVFCLFFGLSYFLPLNIIEQELLQIKTHQPFDVKVNPYRKNELSALIRFELYEPAVITMSVKGRDNANDIVHTFPGKHVKHEIPVLGLYPDYQNQVVLTADYGDRKEQSVVFIRLPKVSKRNLFVVKTKKDAKDRYHWLSDGIVFDENGWLRFSFDGNGMIGYWFNHEVILESRTAGLFRYTPIGKFLKHYSFPKGFVSFSHGLGQKPNKNFLVIGSFADSYIMTNGEKQQTHRDHMIEIDYQTGEVVNTIDFAELVNPHRSVIVPEGHEDYGLNDWCHINGIDYDATDNSIVISCRHAGMIKVNEKTKELIWMVTPRKGFEKSGRMGDGKDIHHKVLTAVNAKGKPYKASVQRGEQRVPDFKWPTKNHNVRVFKNGVFGLFDNSGPINDETVVTTPDSYASLYRIDSQKQTVHHLWLQPLGVRSDTGSSVEYNDKENDVTVFVSQIYDKSQQHMSYAALIRYDFDTHEELFHAVIYRGGMSWYYSSNEVTSFYPPTH